MTPGPVLFATVVVCVADEATRGLLCDRLASDRFEPLPAAFAEEALRLCRHHRPDILVVDLELPEDSGPELLSRIREAHWLKTRIDPWLPVIALRPRAQGPETDEEPDLGADDHLDKPFSYDELRSRIDAILRRRPGRLDEPVRVGELLVDPSRRRVTVGEREVKLARKEFTLLRVLASDPTRVFAKEELLLDVWGVRGPAKTRTLDSHASRLRRRLDPEGGRYVVNCWGIGYSLQPGDARPAGPLDGPDAPEERRLIGARVARLMEVAGFSVAALAERSGTDASIIEAILAGGRPVGLDELGRLAAALGVPAGGLLIDTRERKEEGDA